VWWRCCAWVLTFGFVVVTWVFFRANSLTTATSMIQSMVSPSSFGTAVKVPNLGGENFAGALLRGWVAVLLAILWALVMPTTQELMRRVMRAAMYRPYIERVTARLQPRWRPTPAWVIGSATIFAVAFLGLSRVSEFIYYNF
jgi:alginate O-acetyltransferase complex protein AlgI